MLLIRVSVNHSKGDSVPNEAATFKKKKMKLKKKS